jgi:hypothetical protein
MIEQQKPIPKWGALGYEQVPGLANRIISRYLRGQRRNMERFFTERGLYDSAERMRQIRLSRQGMMAKNRMFQEVLNEYARRATPESAAETDTTQAEGRAGVAVPRAASDLDVHADGLRSDAGSGVHDVAVRDGDDGFVIEE